jgi:DNA repair protein RecN (Recombination protein N)
VNLVLIEVSDINDEIKNLASKVSVDPQRLESLQSQMSILYQLFETFRVQKTSELLEKKQELENKIEDIINFENKIELLKIEIAEQEKELKKQAQDITGKRKEVFSEIEKSVISILKDLGMPYVQFVINHKISKNLTLEGQDNIIFLFTANLGQDLQEIASSASGGEVSRIMFALKSLISAFTGLPTIIFDEIDTGISGKIAEQMGKLMKKMGINCQILSITHLPQIAAKGDHHFLVEKEHLLGQTTTNIKQIKKEDRVKEIEQMLSGVIIEN